MVETYGFHTGHNKKPSGIKAEIQKLKLVTLNCGKELSHSVVKNYISSHSTGHFTNIL